MTVTAEAARLFGFAILAVITNTTFPYPFEPVLLVFANGATSEDAIVLSAIASIAAGVAAIVDYCLLGIVRNKLFGEGIRDFHRWWFYALVFASALLPVPYTVTRAALLRGRPNVLLFAITVSLARFPRYLLTIHMWYIVAPPTWVVIALAILGTIMAAHALRRQRHGRGRAAATVATV